MQSYRRMCWITWHWQASWRTAWASARIYYADEGCFLAHLQADALDKEALGIINAYSPGLSGAWMLQRAMSLRVGQRQDPNFVNKLLGTNFGAMQRLGNGVLMPFLQVRFDLQAVDRSCGFCWCSQVLALLIGHGWRT